LDVLFSCKLNQITITKLVGVFHTYDTTEWRKFTGNSEGAHGELEAKVKNGVLGFCPQRSPRADRASGQWP